MSSKPGQPQADDVEQRAAEETRVGMSAGRNLLYVPTQPELRITVPDSFAPPGLSPEYVPTAPPEDDAERQDLPTLVFGLLESVQREASKVALLRLDGATAGQLHSLGDGAVVIGRGGGSELVVEDSGVSRCHATIWQADGEWKLRDLGSRNGTFVNDRRIDTSVLEHGAMIRLGPVVCFAFQVIDARQEATLRRLFETSDRDAITGVHNRRYADERLHTEVSAALRHQRMLSLVVIDIDDFRSVNRRQGHVVGDAVLRHVAECLAANLRTEDVLARHAGDEFVLILRETGALEAAVTAERLRKQLEDSAAVTDAGKVVVSLSAGCAELAECEPATVASLRALASQRLAKAKAAGRNRIVMA